MKNGMIKDKHGTKMWYLNGQLHRTDGPAVERANGTKKWYRHDQLHREDGPALELADGTKYWYQNRQRHREDGPAIEYWDGTKMWYQNGQRHRTDGPAVVWANGEKGWYRSGYKYGISKKEDGIHIGYKVKSTIADWDDWFYQSSEEFKTPRVSQKFQVLLELWEQFKAQVD